jgi:iron complex transport system permease protein
MSEGVENIRLPGARVVRNSANRLTLGRLAWTMAVLIGALILISLVAVAVGSEHVSLASICRICWAGITGHAASVPGYQVSIIADVRLPRILTAVTVGAALSVAGAAYQGLLKNPLADPYILGVSTGAAVGAIVATIFAESILVGRPIAAFVGAVLTMAAVYGLGQGGRGSQSDRLVLSGIITNTFLSSVVIFLLTASSGSQLRSIFSWLIGDLSGTTELLPLVGGIAVVGIVVVFLNARSLNLLMIGDQDAQALGVEVRRVRFVMFAAASLITGAVVAISGVIGFVGLVVPHAVRMVCGSDNRIVIPASGLVGASFLLLADLIARTVLSPREIHIGVITALIGAPVFVYLLRRSA